MKKSRCNKKNQDCFRITGTFFFGWLRRLLRTNRLSVICSASATDTLIEFHRYVKNDMISKDEISLVFFACWKICFPCELAKTMKVMAISVFFGLSVSAYGQRTIPDSLKYLFLEQLTVFPQEKIYLHTDKPYYITGEKIWFRAYLVDAVTHVPFPASRYVYVELFNPLDSLISRVKIRNDNDAYHGYINIPADIPEGDYTIRAYTTFMLNQDAQHFCHKNVRIGDPQSRIIQTTTNFTFESDKRVIVKLAFSYVGLSLPLVPKAVNISVNDGNSMSVEVDEYGTAVVSFNLPDTLDKRVILLETVATKNPYRQYIRFPKPDDDFDVSFYPEGGNLLQGTACNVAFKAMKSDSEATNLTGIIYDQDGNEIRTIASDYMGMGNFLLTAEKGKTYHALCTNNKGQSKRFELPEALDYGYTLSVQQAKDYIYFIVLMGAQTSRLHNEEQTGRLRSQNNDLYLLAHTRGEVHFADQLDNDRIVIRKDRLPSGVLHIILFDAALNPVSERLVFINNLDQAQVTCQPDQEQCAPRSLVKNQIMVTDSEGQPLTGSFSVSVTSDREVTPDSTTNILTHLLLTSDLRGYITYPAYYFQNNNAAAFALDLLMQTQGWRRYNTADLAQGRFAKPTFPIEIGAEISGTVKNLLTGKPVNDIEISIAALSDSCVYFDQTRTDAVGRFLFLPQ